MSRRRILVVDDERDITMMLKLNLEEGGDYEVREENQSQQVLATAKAFAPNLILLDLRMPGMNGLEVLKELKADQKTVAIPVLILSAVVDEKRKRETVSLYSHGYLEKPININQLHLVVQEALRF